MKPNFSLFKSPPSRLKPLAAGVLPASCILLAGAAVAQTMRVPSDPGTTVTVTVRPPGAAKIPEAAPPIEDAPPLVNPIVGNQINVLVLALDEADIKAARAVGIKRLPPKPELVPTPEFEDEVIPVPLEEEGELEEEVIVEVEEEELEEEEEEADDEEPPALLPPPPARPRVPAGGITAPAIEPAAFGGQSVFAPVWKSHAQQGTIRPMTPPPGTIQPMTPPKGGAGNAPRGGDRTGGDRTGGGGNLLPNLPILPRGEGDEMEMPSRRAPGRAQLAAAPLRRAMTAAGLRDVLTAPLDSATIVRSVKAGRISSRVLDSLRFSTGQMLESTPQAPLYSQARQKAIQAASRIGLSLGYRAVVVLALTPGNDYSYLLVDTTRETGESFVVLARDAGEAANDQSAAREAADKLAARLVAWKPFTSTDRAQRIEEHMAAAQEAIERNDLAATQDQLGQAVSLDPSYAAAYILLGDVLQASDPISAASAYQRAVEINTRNGAVWSKIAMTHTLSRPPDWVRSLSAAAKAQQYGFDSANLRTAMAASEFGRAELLRRGGRPDQAEDAEAAARRHLDRARELSNDEPEATAGISRLMAKYLLDQKRYREAVQALELLAMQYPDDLETQRMIARALEGQGTRSEDIFLAWSRVWKLTGETEVLLDTSRYARIADGFDQRLVNISKNVFQMTSGVATGALLRETAILQTARLATEMTSTIDALKLMRPPVGRASSDAHISRLFAVDLMQQAMDSYSQFLETGQEDTRARAVDLHRQAIESLNTARAGGAA